MPTDEETSAGARRPISLAALVLAALGVAVSAYLTIEHYTTALTLACPESATINCQKVTTSQWSKLFGVPVALLGLIFFVVMLGLVLPVAWRVPALDWVRLGAAAGGVLMVLYLIYIELFKVDAICLWCTAVHVCTVALFGVLLWRTSLSGERPV